MTQPHFCFAFVCRSGPLEAKAVLLAASLRRHLPSSLDADLVAAVPGSDVLSAVTLAALERLRVRRVGIRNRLDPGYLPGLKLGALAVTTRAPVTVFLDSDVLMLRPPSAIELAALDAGIAAVPASLAHASEATWTTIYRGCGLPLPKARIDLLQNGDRSLPYFNSGLVASRQAIRLADAWTEAALCIDSDPQVPFEVRRPWLEQLALPVAAQALHWPVRLLSPTWNFPSWAWQMPRRALPVLYHYQEPDRFLRERRVHELARALAWDEPTVTEVLAEDPWFRPLLVHGWLTRKVARRIARQVQSARASAA